MLGYAVNRVVWTIPVLLLAVTLTFFLVNLVADLLLAALDPRHRERHVHHAV